ncbi:MAG: hypothetical protein HC915_03805 [Anaerolineae bacterium]|nr:hypothetical protein [Anaerolineae bacterium]
MSRTSRYLAGVSSGYVVTAANILVSLALTPIVLRYLSAEEYGIFTLGASLILLLTLLDLGVAAGINVHLAQHIGKLSAAEISRYASSGFFVQLGVSGAVLLGAAC